METSPFEASRLDARFGDQAFDQAARDFLDRHAHCVRVEPGAMVFVPGQACDAYLLVLDGALRVHLLDVGGQEVVLYRVTAGDSCVITTSAILGHCAYTAYAVTESPLTAVRIPSAAFHALLERSPGFRKFVFAMHGQRLAALMGVIGGLAFHSIGRRLARTILERADRQGTVALTHEALARELGSAREVVSRKLKAFESAGAIALQRGAVQILDGPWLEGAATA